MLSKELLKKIHRLEIRTARAVDEVMAGDYKSAFRGAGMEFDEVREYQPGDDVRSIDWNVTARQGRPFIKRFHEERELTVFFVVDCSASGRFGRGEHTKNDLAAELCATLAFSAVKSNDKVGLLLFTDRVERFIPPGKGINHAMRIVTEVLTFHPEGRGTDIAGALEHLGRALHKRAVVFLLSDFINGGDYRQVLGTTARCHDLVALKIEDPAESQLPMSGLVAMADAESAQTVLVDTADPRVRELYHAAYAERQSARDAIIRHAGVESLTLRTGEDFMPAVAGFFRHRRLR